ncbi:selenocysteine lyase/cysteine desulfurase [Saccharopolyspora erythraea NRRL 2338]|uniref:Aminotransferase class V-fold PLP-dependent enzyme n=1 Tax=Saccharopolyspora erythraea TaxID=1836 RepID=A0ABP3N780_SACER|nr:aminotransferase class V-fold PLP-dependent enzyme [Saccharopolyspora erythraea]PFG97092.1 selenocysteine lyase/cysteine desulfurase [Saccharopolyspora erythraea NRRL 2338]QRK87302.1 aminotransferase class V-fold PLP-dependent enzyme [Saccharopolyspora erythraea]
MPHARGPRADISPLPAVIGADLRVPVVSGDLVPHANLDHAATTPCLRRVHDAVRDVLPWYASVHRGAGFASRVSSRAYEQARDSLRRFAGASADSEVLFTRNTTDALNLLARCLPPGTAVLRFDTEHHAALLPWAPDSVVGLGMPDSPEAAARLLSAALRRLPAGPKLVVLTGASNVTGELWPVAELAEIARRHGARTVLDAAQLAPHRPLSMTGWQVDWVALSGHKMYAPFGAGALVGSPEWLADAQPYLVGGGATANVTANSADSAHVTWCGLPARHEAGSPNVVGAHALAAACDELTELGWDFVTAHEQALVDRLREGLAALPGVRPLSMWPGRPGVGVVSFAIDPHAGKTTDADLLAAALSAEHGVSVRSGLFCAHMLTRRLMSRTGAEPGPALRASVGLDTTTEHVDRLLAGLERLLLDGPGAHYRLLDGRWAPDPDPRPFPTFLGEAELPALA